jgi:hypothetical protein
MYLQNLGITAKGGKKSDVALKQESMTGPVLVMGAASSSVIAQESMTGPVLVMGAASRSGNLKLTRKASCRSVRESMDSDRVAKSETIITSIKERSSMSMVRSNKLILEFKCMLLQEERSIMCDHHQN